ncbi:MAG: cytochrome C oxidase subunit II [Gammaproteobacteria bacterium]|nr:MAG: cytochrome C oxidase subunit II [Gammaproteobacteria bacterium]
MHIDPLEKLWIYVVAFMVMVMFGSILYMAVARNIHPPSNVETVNSATLHLGGEFAEDNLGVKTNPDGSVRVTMVATRYGFYPQHIEVPAHKKVTFRMASTDVIHGVHIPRTNMSTMIVPGFVAEVSTVFTRPGEYPMLCNEYCGLGHDYMWSRVTVKGE